MTSDTSILPGEPYRNRTCKLLIKRQIQAVFVTPVLAFAHLLKNQIEDAGGAFQKPLDLDPHNAFAMKNPGDYTGIAPLRGVNHLGEAKNLGISIGWKD